MLDGHYEAAAVATREINFEALLSCAKVCSQSVYLVRKDFASGCWNVAVRFKGRKNGFSRAHPSPSVFFVLLLRLRFPFSLTSLQTRPAPLSRAPTTEDLAGAAWPLTPSCQRPWPRLRLTRTLLPSPSTALVQTDRYAEYTMCEFAWSSPSLLERSRDPVAWSRRFQTLAQKDDFALSAEGNRRLLLVITHLAIPWRRGILSY